VKDDAAAAGVRLEPALLADIDRVLDGWTETDPAKSARPNDVPAGWRRAAP
jgi:hypothetical protein